MSDSPEAQRGEQFDTPNWLQLSENEDLLWSGRQSLWTYIPALITGVLLALAGIALAIVGPDLPSFVPAGSIGAGFILVAFGIIIAGVTYLQYRLNLYAITSEQVYHRSGILARNVNQVRMEQIQNTSCNQSVIERLLSFGDVQLDTAGSAQVELHLWGVNNPQSINQTITNQLNRLSGQSRSGNSAQVTA